jgi:hypothetical protein
MGALIFSGIYMNLPVASGGTSVNSDLLDFSELNEISQGRRKFILRIDN